jgi:phosphoribosylformylglycinamidine synthase subunit PurQ / glutaminase
MTTVGVCVFPGSNCDHDVLTAFERAVGVKAIPLWHKDRELRGVDAVVLPGGFSYGDYLRTGAMAKLSPIMEEVKHFAARGGPVLGVCNGFQILCEAGLLPGVLLQNECMHFLSQFVTLRIENSTTPFTRASTKGDLLTCPIAHGEGNYFLPDDDLRRVEEEGQVAFRYVSPEGALDPSNRSWNPNGSLNSIAGVTNKQGNVVGLMPHPERSAEGLIGGPGGESGKQILQSLLC